LTLVPLHGSWEVRTPFLGARYQLTAVYGPQQITELDVPVRRARIQTGSALVPATAVATRALRDALKQGKVVALPPDQVTTVSPAIGAFFCRPAVTMTLAYRLIQTATPRVLLGCARRTRDASGLGLGFEVLSEAESPGHAELALATKNAAIESLIRKVRRVSMEIHTL